MGCKDDFVKILKQRLIDCRWLCLDDHIQTNEIVFIRHLSHCVKWNLFLCEIIDAR